MSSKALIAYRAKLLEQREARVAALFKKKYEAKMKALRKAELSALRAIQTKIREKGTMSCREAIEVAVCVLDSIEGSSNEDWNINRIRAIITLRAMLNELDKV